jgi:hypothetical protein
MHNLHTCLAPDCRAILQTGARRQTA